METAFRLPDADGVEFVSSEHLPLIVYFYPKDSTSGCTKEAQEFTELAGEFASLGWTVAGISRDSQKSHKNFICRYGLGITLLSDSDEAVCNQFGVLGEKTMYGRKVIGLSSQYLSGAAPIDFSSGFLLGLAFMAEGSILQNRLAGLFFVGH